MPNPIYFKAVSRQGISDFNGTLRAFRKINKIKIQNILCTSLAGVHHVGVYKTYTDCDCKRGRHHA